MLFHGWNLKNRSARFYPSHPDYRYIVWERITELIALNTYRLIGARTVMRYIRNSYLFDDPQKIANVQTMEEQFVWWRIQSRLECGLLAG